MYLPSAHELVVTEGNLLIHHAHAVQLSPSSAFYKVADKKIYFRTTKHVNQRTNVKNYTCILEKLSTPHLLIYVTIVYRCTKFVILNYCTSYVTSNFDKGSKNLKVKRTNKFHQVMFMSGNPF